jgi:hypothetical protein
VFYILSLQIIVVLLFETYKIEKIDSVDLQEMFIQMNNYLQTLVNSLIEFKESLPPDYIEQIPFEQILKKPMLLNFVFAFIEYMDEPELSNEKIQDIIQKNKL